MIAMLTSNLKQAQQSLDWFLEVKLLLGTNLTQICSETLSFQKIFSLSKIETLHLNDKLDMGIDQ